MGRKVQIGNVKMLQEDLPDAMEWMEHRFAKRSDVEKCLLALMVAEGFLGSLRYEWPYEEDVNAGIEGLRRCARENVAELYRLADAGE